MTHFLSWIAGRCLIGYDKCPPLPVDSRIDDSSYFLKLGQHVSFTRHIAIKQYNLEELSQTITESKISAAKIKTWFVEINEFHALNRFLRHKLREYLFPILSTSMSLSLTVYALRVESWVYSTAELFKPWQKPMPDACLLYFLHCGYYTFRLLQLTVTVKPSYAVRKEVWVHHIISLILLVCSYCSGQLRIGVVVLFLHDPGELLLPCAKLMKMLRVGPLSDHCFTLTCAVWVVTRIILLLCICLYPAVVQMTKSQQIDIDEVMLIMMLSALYAMHWRWLFLVGRCVVKAWNRRSTERRSRKMR